MTMPAGRYYIGDLCYVMHDEWDECCNLFFPYVPGQPQHHAEGEFTLKDGRRFASFGTRWGDGTYGSNIGTSHCVDSGSIGCIRAEDIRDGTYSSVERLGGFVDFDQSFEVSNHNGVLKFGHVEIDTTGEEEYDCFNEEE
jgi:hypothetical protein